MTDWPVALRAGPVRLIHSVRFYFNRFGMYGVVVELLPHKWRATQSQDSHSKQTAFN